MVVHGYRMKQLTMNELQEQIDKLHKKYQLQVKKEYGRLLGEEIAFLCDQIALNVVPKPRISIFEQAKQNLNQQLQVAKMNGTKQNLQVVMYVMPEDEYVYLNVKFHNPVFEKIFKHLEPYSLTEEEYADEDNTKRIQWERLNQKALKTPPMGISFFEIPEVVKGDIRYLEKGQRCMTEARHNVTNRLLNQMSGGQQIPPVLLMRFFDQAMDLLLLPETQWEIRQKQAELQAILPDLQQDDQFIYGEEEPDNGNLEEYLEK